MPDQQKYTNKLSGKHILIIGGTSGIGFAVAEASLEFGAHVTLASSRESRLSHAVSRLQTSYPSATSRISAHAVDLANETTLEANITALLDASTNHGAHKLDHIVYTAGDRLPHQTLAETDFEAAKQFGVVRFFGPLFVGKHAPRYLHPGPSSSLVLTTGVGTERPIPGRAGLAVTGGLQGLSRSLALENAPIRCNLVSPGLVETELWENFPEEAQKGMREWGNRLPTGGVGRTEDVAEAYLYAMRDEFLTGSMISTNGGTLLQG
ncbi:MAG: hypothetical protein Q9165_008087 [Trypethelium subeluteriae]